MRIRHRRTGSVLVVILALAGMVGLFALQGQTPRRLLGPSGFGKPNIVFILAADLGCEDLGCYGPTEIKTPNLDRIAGQGMRFTQGYAGSSLDSPSRAVLLTGLHTGHGPIRVAETGELKSEDVTLAEVLKEGGYLTCALGLWGLGTADSEGAPNRQGFAQWFGFPESIQGREAFPEFIWRNDLKWPVPGNQGRAPSSLAQDWFTRAATNYFRTSRAYPFFLFLSYPMPRFGEGPRALGSTNMALPEAALYALEKWPQARKQRAAMISRLDADIGRLMENLKLHKLEDLTVVFVAGTSGPASRPPPEAGPDASSRRLRGGSGDLYEGGIRVPLLVRWPGKIKAAAVCDEVVAGWDFPATAAELGGVKWPVKIDGISRVPTLLAGTQTNHHEYLYWEVHHGGAKQAARWQHWKAVRASPDLPLELYDLKRDPLEREDVAAAHPAVVEKMETFLKTARADDRKRPLSAPEVPRPSDQEANPNPNP